MGENRDTQHADIRLAVPRVSRIFSNCLGGGSNIVEILPDDPTRSRRDVAVAPVVCLHRGSMAHLSLPQMREKLLQATFRLRLRPNLRALWIAEAQTHHHHAVNSPHKCKFGRVRHRACWLTRGARPGLPGRQTAGASSRTPREAFRERARWLHARRLCTGHGMPCPYKFNFVRAARRPEI